MSYGGEEVSAHQLLEGYVESLKELPLDIMRIYALVGVLDHKSKVATMQWRTLQHDILRAANLPASTTSRTSKSASAQRVTPQLLAAMRAKEREVYALICEKEAAVKQAVSIVKSFQARLDHDMKLYESNTSDIVQPPSDIDSEDLEDEEGQMDAADGGMAADVVNDQLYCYCQRVSFGAMVACDSESCPIEWFHLSCVGLDTPPSGAWYCDECYLNA